ncbi:hypothetical protein ACLI1A_13360 [Flavobacterium sp. RHBU_3]|uniref:hypothetical protein n=1 Tax=Flavobacterium sp. RHBU_3 TaxID=3391184 RepID=UPI003984B6C5
MIANLTNTPPIIDFGFGTTVLNFSIFDSLPYITVWQNTLYHPALYNPVLTAPGANIEVVSPYEYRLTFDEYDENTNSSIQLTFTAPNGQTLYSNILSINFSE